MPSQPKDVSESFRQAQTGASSVSRLEPVRALHRVLAEIAHGPYSQDASAELLALLADELGTSGCHVVVVDRDDDPDGNEVLIPLASAGQYGALLRDMPPIELDSPLEAAPRVPQRRGPLRRRATPPLGKRERRGNRALARR